MTLIAKVDVDLESRVLNPADDAQCHLSTPQRGLDIGPSPQVSGGEVHPGGAGQGVDNAWTCITAVNPPRSRAPEIEVDVVWRGAVQAQQDLPPD